MTPQAAKATTIGLFDSGVGGLSVLRQLAGRRISPLGGENVRFIYLGDTARCPYGGRQAAEIQQFVRQTVSWLAHNGATYVVMACNTSAANAGAVARSEFNLPIYDLIGPTARALASRAGKIAVMATQATVTSLAFTNAIRSVNPKAQVVEIACPDLVPLVERGILTGKEAEEALAPYVRRICAEGSASVVLGCTHYPFLARTLAAMLPAVELVDPAEELALELWGQLESVAAHDEEGEALKPAEVNLHVTGDPLAFSHAAQACMGRMPGTISGINIAELESAAPAIGIGAIPPVVPFGQAAGSRTTGLHA